ncbi:hypothetical protein QQX98_008934 [Neonectria punicea]|uniref:NACHT domain-containing protein n=1 Tax=Neonectria punicea TaxID=979145 RepID=A0ABR1GTN3_9HYPO
MDPLSALSVAAAVIQFIDFGMGVGREMRSMYNKGSPRSVGYFEKTISELHDFMALLEHRPRLIETSDNDKAIDGLIAECRAAAQRLCNILSEATGGSDKYAKFGQPLNQAFNVTRQSIKIVWKDSEINEIQTALNNCRSQFVLRLLLSLNTKADVQLQHDKSLETHISNVVEVLAIYQERQQASIVSQTQHLENRIQESDHRIVRLHEETVAAILTLANGEKKVLRSAASPEDGLTTTPRHAALQFKAESREFSTHGHATVTGLRSAEQRILNSLYFRYMTDRYETVRPPHKETYQWIFCDPVAAEKPWDDFLAWLQGDGGIYWICGKAGSGKSTLTRFIYEDPRTLAALQRWAGDNTLALGSFFFWGLGNSVQKSQEGLLRSLLHDILSKDPCLIPLVMMELLPMVADPNAPQRLAEPSLAELMKWFKRLLDQSNSRKYFFLIDGIDEYHGDPSKLVELISSISQSSNVKFLVSSRPIPSCVDTFATVPKLHLHDLTRDDIRRYSEDLLGPRLRERDESWTMLIYQIVEKSSGVFIWVELSVKSLLRGLENRDKKAELLERLDQLPSDLAELYSHMLGRMSSMYRKQAAQLFRIALEAIQAQEQCPLLTVQVSFIDDQDSPALDLPIRPMSKRDELQRSDHIDGRIRSRCCGLLETRRPKPSERKLVSSLHFHYPCVDFLHRTVVEFLTDAQVWSSASELDDPTFVPSALLFHSSVQTCKIRPLELSVDGDSSLTWQMMRNAMRYAALSEESNKSVPSAHLRELDRTMAQYWPAVKNIEAGEREIKPAIHWAGSFSVMNPPFPERSLLVTALHPIGFESLALAHNLVTFIKDELILQTSRLNKETSAKSRLLHCAVGQFFVLRSPEMRKLSQVSFHELSTLTICQQLLSHGADPNARPGNSGESMWNRLLHHVLFGGCGLNSGSGVSVEGRNLSERLARLVEAFVVAGAAVDIQKTWWSDGAQSNKRPELQRWSPLDIITHVFAPVPELREHLSSLVMERLAAQSAMQVSKASDASPATSESRIRLRRKLGLLFRKPAVRGSG